MLTQPLFYIELVGRNLNIIESTSVQKSLSIFYPHCTNLFDAADVHKSLCTDAQTKDNTKRIKKIAFIDM